MLECKRFINIANENIWTISHSQRNLIIFACHAQHWYFQILPIRIKGKRTYFIQHSTVLFANEQLIRHISHTNAIHFMWVSYFYVNLLGLMHVGMSHRSLNSIPIFVEFEENIFFLPLQIRATILRKYSDISILLIRRFVCTW